MVGICPVPSRDRPVPWEYAPFPHAIGPHGGNMPRGGGGVGPDVLRESAAAGRVRLLSGAGLAGDWPALWEYAPFPHAIGPRGGNMPRSLA
eukprot:1196336-Prorocentrum_minimum.AAC.4